MKTYFYYSNSLREIYHSTEDRQSSQGIQFIGTSEITPIKKAAALLMNSIDSLAQGIKLKPYPD